MKWIMCMMAVGGQHDGEINCKVKEVPDEMREHMQLFCEHLMSNSDSPPVVCEEFDPNKDYGGVIHFEEDGDDIDVEEWKQKYGIMPGDSYFNIKTVEKE